MISYTGAQLITVLKVKDCGRMCPYRVLTPLVRALKNA